MENKRYCHVFAFTCTLYFQPIDIGSIVSQRLAAMRKLRENPNDVCAQNEMYRAQNEVLLYAIQNCIIIHL